MNKEINQTLSALVEELRSMLEDEHVPNWKKGEPVPKGYLVVFGKLRKEGKPDQYGVHVPSTDAWNRTAMAKAKNRGAENGESSAEDAATEHDTAAGAHEEAAKAHATRARRTRRPTHRYDHEVAADAHMAQAEAHRKEAKDLRGIAGGHRAVAYEKDHPTSR
jgi:hypothetical protein